MSFAEQLRKERDRIGYTQQQAAALLEVSNRVYWEWEKDKTTPYPITQEGALARLKNTKTAKV